MNTINTMLGIDSDDNACCSEYAYERSSEMQQYPAFRLRFASESIFVYFQ